MFATEPRGVGLTIVWPKGVIFRSMMTYHVPFLLLVLAGDLTCAPQKVDPALIARFRPAMLGCFVPVAHPQAARSPLWRKRGTRKSTLETNTENEARSALLARLWCHLPLQNPANRAENLTRLCSAQLARLSGGWCRLELSGLGKRRSSF